MVIFESKQKKFEGDLKIKLCSKLSKRLYPTESVEAVVWRCSVEKVFLKISQNSQEKRDSGTGVFL